MPHGEIPQRVRSLRLLYVHICLSCIHNSYFVNIQWNISHVLGDVPIQRQPVTSAVYKIIAAWTIERVCTCVCESTQNLELQMSWTFKQIFDLSLFTRQYFRFLKARYNHGKTASMSMHVYSLGILWKFSSMRSLSHDNKCNKKPSQLLLNAHFFMFSLKWTCTLGWIIVGRVHWYLATYVNFDPVVFKQEIIKS